MDALSHGSAQLTTTRRSKFFRVGTLSDNVGFTIWTVAILGLLVFVPRLVLENYGDNYFMFGWLAGACAIGLMYLVVSTLLKVRWIYWVPMIAAYFALFFIVIPVWFI